MPAEFELKPQSDPLRTIGSEKIFFRNQRKLRMLLPITLRIGARNGAESQHQRRDSRSQLHRSARDHNNRQPEFYRKLAVHLCGRRLWPGGNDSMIYENRICRVQMTIIPVIDRES